MITKYEIALEEIKNNFRLQCEGIDSCKESVRSFLNSSGLIIALLSLFDKKSGNFLYLGIKSVVFWAWFITFLLFILMVFAYIAAINPIKIEAPIKSTKEKFSEVFFDQTDKNALKKLITKYQETIERNRNKLIRVSIFAKITNWLGALSIFSALVSYFLAGL